MLIWAYCIVSLSIFKIILDIANPELFSKFSVILDNVLFFLILALIINIVSKQKSGKREELKNHLAELEKNIAEVEEK